MGAPRRLAALLLRAALRLSPPTSREWASAMLREIDFVPGDWAALLWALGSAAAILRHAGRNWRQWFTQPRLNGEKPMNSTGKKTIGVVSGAVAAIMVVACAFALLRITDLLFPGLGIARTEWTHWLSIIVIPEAIFIAAAIALWRKKGPIAAGILLVAVAIGLHVIVHMAGH
jgi:hypothetical protein